MPKRNNPFGESSPLQLKSHISQKEINFGVCGEDNLRQIYDYTRQLLFSRVQNIPPATTNNLDEKDDPSWFNRCSTPPPGQLCLNNQGHITAPSEVNINNNNDEDMENVAKLKNPAKCLCCGYEAVLRCQCSFCDRRMCQHCLRNCNTCADVFCTNCSILNYDESQERAFCLNCVT